MPRYATLSAAYAAAEEKTQTVDPGLADRITGIVWADAAGSLKIEQSADGTNWDLSTTIAAIINTGVAVSVEIVAPYVRAHYINGAGVANVRCAVRFTSAGPR
jgi:hypothetical protein